MSRKYDPRRMCLRMGLKKQETIWDYGCGESMFFFKLDKQRKSVIPGKSKAQKTV